MSYKTVLVHVDDSRHAAQRIALAGTIARHWNGHLVGAAFTGIARFIYGTAPAPGSDALLELHLAALRERAQLALERAADTFNAAAPASFETCLIDDEPGDGISRLARCADLVVISQLDPDHPPATVMSDFPAYVVSNAGSPVLLVPRQAVVTAPGRTVVLAWDASREAARALASALPFLRQADMVHVIAVAGDADGVLAPVLMPFLERHGVRASFALRAPPAGRWADGTGHALLAQARDLSADLLVMGAYGRSRLRETILGGVTRTVLDSMTMPVLMAR